MDYSPFPVDPIYKAKLLIGPFERLRRVQNPRLTGIFHDQGFANSYRQRHRAYNDIRNPCVTPPPLEPVPILTRGMPAFDAFAGDWEHSLALEGPSNILPASPITKLFVEFKTLHNKLADIVPSIVRSRRHCFLHRARVAREHEDIVSFRAVAAELLACWRHHLQLQELQRQEANSILQRMIEADTYPYESQNIAAIESQQ